MLDLNVGSVVGCLSTCTVTVRRTAPNSIIGGRLVKGAETVFNNVQASVQSPSPRDLRALPEGERTGYIRSIYTEMDLKTVDQLNNISADIIEYNGRRFKVIGDHDWQKYGYSHLLMIEIKV